MSDRSHSSLSSLRQKQKIKSLHPSACLCLHFFKPGRAVLGDFPYAVWWCHPAGQLNSSTSTFSLALLKQKGGENRIKRAQGLR